MSFLEDNHLRIALASATAADILILRIPLSFDIRVIGLTPKASQTSISSTKKDLSVLLSTEKVMFCSILHSPGYLLIGKTKKIQSI